VGVLKGELREGAFVTICRSVRPAGSLRKKRVTEHALFLERLSQRCSKNSDDEVEYIVKPSLKFLLSDSSILHIDEEVLLETSAHIYVKVVSQLA
jgi:hypothetical protein